VGIQLQTHGLLPEAAKAYLRAEGLLRPLVKQFPGVPGYELELARAVINLGNLKLAERPAEAEKAYAEALGRLGRLVDRDPQARDPAFERAGANYLLATLLQTRGEAKEAEKRHKAAAAALKALAGRYADYPEYRHVLASCYNNLADLYRAGKRPKDAEDTWKQAERLLAQLAREVPAQPAYPRERARALHNLGVLYN